MELNGKYFLTDYESGDLYEVTKEQHDNYLNFLKLALGSVKNHVPKLGKPVIIGTVGGEISGTVNLRDLFYVSDRILRPEETKEDNL